MCKQSPPGSPAASLLAKETPVDGGAAAATYTAFLDALLTNVCCADKGTSDLDTDSTKDFAVGGRSDGVVSGGGNVDVSADRGSPLSSSTGNGGDGINKSTINDVINNNDHTITAMDHKEPLAESILSHLRFNPLLSSSSKNRRGDDNNFPTSTSSLDEFFDLFLRDDAPHSFLSFHKSKGDKEIKATPWKIGQTEDRLERTITFITKFTPKNLQEPEQEKEVAATPSSSSTRTITDISNNPDISNPTLTLAVTSHQTLSRQPSTMILESLFSFDFVNDSIHKTSLTKMLNLSLTQFLISNDVKGSEVNVRVVLKEGDGGVNSTTDKTTTARGEQQVIHPFLLPDRLIPSLSGDPLSKSILDVNDHDGSDNNKNNYKDGGSGCNVMEENPSCIGASLLSAIRARNSPTPPKSRPKSRTSKRNSSPVDEAALLIAKHSESITPNRKKKQDLLPPLLQKRDIADDTTYDVLRTASSRGSLKFKQVSSFEAGVNPGEMAMRRMLWEKDRSGGIGRGGNGNNTVLRRDETNTTSDKEDGPSSSSSSLLLPFNLSPREGLSMHIEMEVRDSSNSSNNNTASSLRHRSSSLSNSSFPRTRSNGVGGPSIAYIEEKVRKGLKKRVARSWITWANSWCMRLWEEEQMERFLRKGSSSPITRRRSTNTRPTVRRVGEKKKSPARGVVIAKKQQTAAPNNNNVEMDKLTVMQKQIQLAESMKAISSRRVVTPTSSPIRETNNESSSVWSPLMVKNGNHSCRWMSSDEEEGQYGVEVRTITPVKSRESGGRSSPMKKIIRGLRSKSVTRA